MRLLKPKPETRRTSEEAGVLVRNVNFAYDGRSVLRGVNLQVMPGNLLALVGPNGVGKSTLLRLIAGVLRPAQGTVSVLGAAVEALSPRARARVVAMVPQSPEWPPGASALELVLLGRNPHLGLLAWESRQDVDIALGALRQTSADGLATRPIDELSGGERQRVAVALALAQETPVILLDEPTANLDLAHQAAVMALLRDLVAAGKTVIAAVHDLTLAAQFADEAVLLHQGRCAAVGSVREVLTPANIRRVYGAEVRIIDHPETGRPVVVNAWRSTAG